MVLFFLLAGWVVIYYYVADQARLQMKTRVRRNSDRRNFHLRAAAYWALCSWDDSIRKSKSFELAELFGCKNYRQLDRLQRVDPAINRALEALTGVHGYTIYKMLVARKRQKRMHLCGYKLMLL